MDFLELVKRLAFETGTELESKIDSVAVPPATAYGQTTEHRSRLVKWIQEAWTDVQEDQEQWNFMVRRIRVDIVKGQHDYAIGTLVNAAEDLKDPHEPPIEWYDYIIPFVASIDWRYIWLVDGTNSPLTKNKCYYVPPERFFGERDRYNDTTIGTPYRYSIDRKGCLVFDTSPAHDNFYIEFEYKTLPDELVEDADVPRMLPKKHHILIVYTAMKFYAGFDETGAQMQRSTKLYRDKMNKLRRDQLKEYSLSGTTT